MIVIFKLIGNILSILNSEENPNQIAAGFAYGALLGLLPMGLMPALLGLLTFIININLGVVALATALYKILSYILDPVSGQIGYAVLKTPALFPFWTKLYNTPFVPYTKFNNTIVMGSLVLGLVLFVPNFFLGKKLVALYRTRLREKIVNLNIMKVFKATSVYKYYEMYRGIRK